MKTAKRKRGFTLVELMIVVAIASVLAALATFGIVKYVASAKAAEAFNAIGHMARAAAGAYTVEHMAGDTLALGAQAGLSATLCATAANTVPLDPGSIKGRKYQSSPAEWATGNLSMGWECLKFSMESPQYYMYAYSSTGSAVNDTFTATARGDLNGNDVLSTFTLTGKILKAGGDIKLVTSPTVFTDEPGE